MSEVRLRCCKQVMECDEPVRRSEKFFSDGKDGRGFTSARRSVKQQMRHLIAVNKTLNCANNFFMCDDII